MIDDTKGHTLVHASTLSKELRDALNGNGGTKVRYRSRAGSVWQRIQPDSK